jgi:hypothetical protein
MKQTAVEWLVEQIKEYDFSPRDNTYLIEIPSWILKEKIEQAKAMENQQHKHTWYSGRVDFILEETTTLRFISFEQYYNETFKK